MSNKTTNLDHLLHILNELQAIDISVIDVSGQTTVTDYMLVCSGRSSRHVKAISQAAMEYMKAQGISSLSDHGLDTGEWALVDFGDYVLHVMQPENRAFYNIEGLWQQPN